MVEEMFKIGSKWVVSANGYGDPAFVIYGVDRTKRGIVIYDEFGRYYTLDDSEITPDDDGYTFANDITVTELGR